MKIKNVNKLKGSDIFVNENFCFETIEWRKEFWQEVKRFRSEDPIAFLSHWSITVKRRKSTLPAKLESLSFGPFFVIDSLNHNSQDPDVMAMAMSFLMAMSLSLKQIIFYGGILMGIFIPCSTT